MLRIIELLDKYLLRVSAKSERERAPMVQSRGWVFRQCLCSWSDTCPFSGVLLAGKCSISHHYFDYFIGDGERVAGREELTVAFLINFTDTVDSSPTCFGVSVPGCPQQAP